MDNDFSMTSPSSPLPPSPFMLPPSPDIFSQAITEQDQPPSSSLSSSLSTHQSSFKFPLPPRPSLSSVVKKRKHTPVTTSVSESTSPPRLSSASLSSSSSSSSLNLSSSLPLFEIEPLSPPSPSQSAPSSSLFALESLPSPLLHPSLSLFAPETISFSNPSSSSSCPSLSSSPQNQQTTSFYTYAFSSFIASPLFSPSFSLTHSPVFSPLSPPPPPRTVAPATSSESTSLPKFISSSSSSSSPEDESILLITECLQNQTAVLPSSSNIATITPTINRIVTKATTTGELILPTQDFETSFSENCPNNVTTTTSTITASLNANTTDQTAANNIFNPRAKKYRILRKPKLFRKGREKKSAFAAIFTHQYPHQMDSIGQDVQMTPEIGSSVDAALDRRQDLFPTEIEQVSSSILAPQSSQNLPFLASHSNFTSNAETPSGLPIEILSNLLPQTSNNDILVALKQRQLILKMQQQLKTAECLKKATQDQMEALQIKTTSNPLPVLTTPMFSNPEEVSSLNNFLNNFLSTAIDVGKCDTRFLSLLTETLSKTLTNKPENSNKVPSSSTVKIDNSFQHQNIVRSNFQTEDNLISPVFQSPFFTNSSHLQPQSKTCSTTSCISSPNIVSSLHSVATSTQQKSSIKNQSKVHLSNNPLIITTSQNHLNNKPIFTFTDSTSSTNVSTPQIPATEMKVSSQPCITSSSSSVFSTGQKPIFRIVSGYKNTKSLKRLKKNRNQGRSKKTSIDNPESTVKTIDTNVITTNVSSSRNLKSSAVVNQNNILIPNLPNMAGISSISPMILPQQTNMNRNNISKGFDNNYLNMNNTISTAKNSAKILRNEIGYQSNPSHTKSPALIDSENHSFLNIKPTNYQPEQQQKLLNERSDLSTAFGALNYLPSATNPQKQPKVAQISGKKVKLPLARSLSDITESIRMKLLAQNGLISNNGIDNTLLLNGLNEILQRQDVNLNQQMLQKNQLYSDLNPINLYPGEIVPRYDRKLFKRISTTKENVKIIQQQDAGLTALMTDILNENLSAINKHPTKNSEILNYITSILNIFGSNRPNEMVSACDLAVNQPLLFLKIYQQLASELSLSNSSNVCKQNQKTPLTKNNSLGNNCSNSNVKSKILRLPKKETKKETLVYGTKILRMSLSSYPLTATTSVLTTSQSAQPKASPIFIPNQIPVFSQILPPTFSSPTKTIHQFRPENPPPSPPSPKQNELYTRPNDPNEVIPPNVVLTMSSLTGGRLDEIVRTSFTSSVCGRPSIVIPNLYMKNKSKSSIKRTPELTQSTQSLPFETQQFLNFPEATSVNVMDTVHSSPPVSSVLPNNWSQISETSSFHSDPTIFLSISSTMPNVETLSSNSCLADPHLTISSTQHSTLSTKVVQIDNALSFQPYNSRRNLVSDKTMFENETFQTSNLSDIQLTANDYLISLQNEKTSKLMELISLQEKLIETSKLTEIKCELLRKETMTANERLMKSRQLALSSGPNQENAHQSQNVHNDHQVMNLITQNNTQSPSKSSSSINCSSSILQTNVFSQNCLQDQNTFSSNLKNGENLNDELENKRNEQSSKNIFYKNSKDCFLFSDQQTIYNKSCKESDKDYEISGSDTRSINILSSFGGFPHVDEEFMNSEYQNTFSNSPMDYQQLNRQLHQIFPDLYHFDSPQNDLLDLKRTEDFDVETRKNDISFKTSGNNQIENNVEIKTKPRQQKVDKNNKTMKLKISNHSSSQPNQTKQGITCETEFKEKLAELLDYVQNCSSNSRVESNNELSFLNRSPMNINEIHQIVNLPNSEPGDSDVDELLDFISKSNHASNENTSMEMEDYASFLSSAHFSVSSAAESTICLESPLNYDRFNLPLTGDITFCQSNSDNSSSGIGSVQSCFNRIDQTPLCMDVSYDQEFGMDGLTPDQNISENHSEFDFSSISPWFKSSNNSLNPSQHNDYQTTSNKLHQDKPMSVTMSSQSIQCPIDSSTASSLSSSSSSTATTSSSSSSYHHLELTPISPDEFPRRDIDKYHIDERRFTFGSDIGSSSSNTFGVDGDFVIREFFDQSMML